MLYYLRKGTLRNVKQSRIKILSGKERIDKLSDNMYRNRSIYKANICFIFIKKGENGNCCSHPFFHPCFSDSFPSRYTLRNICIVCYTDHYFPRNSFFETKAADRAAILRTRKKSSFAIPLHIFTAVFVRICCPSCITLSVPEAVRRSMQITR